MPFPDQLSNTPPQVQPNPYIFPSEFVAGDTFTFRVADSQPYRIADGWSYALSLRSVVDAPIDLTSTVDGDFLILAVPNTTKDWTPGDYTAQLYAVNTGKRVTTLEAFITITRNLATSQAGADLRSHARRTLDLIEALIEGRSTNDIVDSTIDNTRFTRMNLDQLLGAHSYYTTKVRSEEAKARAKAGFATGRNILTRFVRPA